MLLSFSVQAVGNLAWPYWAHFKQEVGLDDILGSPQPELSCGPVTSHEMRLMQKGRSAVWKKIMP